MAYEIENSGFYEVKRINGKSIYLFDSHNLALPVWGTVCNRNQRSYGLITFDTHTDTHPPFHLEIINKYGRYNKINIKRFKADILDKIGCRINDFEFEQVLKLAHGYITNAEHIRSAYCLGYLNSYIIFCSYKKENKDSFQREDRGDGYNATYHSKETFLKLNADDINIMCEKPFILDFDLDYFVSPNEFNPDFEQRILPIIRNAEAITIAREPEWFEIEKESLEYPGYNVKEAERMLIELIHKALE